METLLAGGERPILLCEFHPEKILRRGGDIETIRKRLREIGYQELRVRASGSAYKLWSEPTSNIGHENILYITPKQLAARPGLRLKQIQH